ncbi:MAG: LppP/LprE family lipoprotein [Frankiaceae bacterium]|nr:LppP/LprE family lipoprotein [Frankiaceae bacterium]MBV9870120.1 LppP/LprE family lipoprotein [Frankiaceae bacterium]
MLKLIHAKGYETSPIELRKAKGYWAGMRPVLVARPQNLANGLRCANVLFISHGRYVGRDSGGCHLYPEISWSGGREVSIVYPRYAKQDPLCCATLNPVRVIFRLVGGHVKPVRHAPPG